LPVSSVSASDAEISTVYTPPEEVVTPRIFGEVGCQASDNTRISDEKNWYVERGSSEVVEAEKRKSWTTPVDAATAKSVGSCGEKWISRIA